MLLVFESQYLYILQCSIMEYKIKIPKYFNYYNFVNSKVKFFAIYTLGILSVYDQLVYQ